MAKEKLKERIASKILEFDLFQAIIKNPIYGGKFITLNLTGKERKKSL